MAVPVQLPSSARDATYGGVTYHVEGKLVPVLQLELDEMPIRFEWHLLLWKDPSVEVEVMLPSGGVKIMIGVVPLFLARATGRGRIALSRDTAGQILAMRLRAGETLDVRNDQFLAATDNVEYGFTRVQGASNILLG